MLLDFVILPTILLFALPQVLQNNYDLSHTNKVKVQVWCYI